MAEGCPRDFRRMEEGFPTDSGGMSGGASKDFLRLKEECPMDSGGMGGGWWRDGRTFCLEGPENGGFPIGKSSNIVGDKTRIE